MTRVLPATATCACCGGTTTTVYVVENEDLCGGCFAWAIGWLGFPWNVTMRAPA